MDTFAREELYASVSFRLGVGPVIVLDYAAGPLDTVLGPVTYTGVGNYNINLAAGNGVDATQIRVEITHRQAFPNSPRPVVANWIGGAGGGGDPDLNLQILCFEEGAGGFPFAAGEIGNPATGVGGLDVAIYRVLPVF